MKIAAIYARVSSGKQKEEGTIASQTAALLEFAKSEGLQVPDEWVFQDDGYSGTNLIRPGLERVRDLAAEGQIQAILIYSPDRLSRKYAYQVLLMEEFARQGVEVCFVNSPHCESPEDKLLLQFQGMIAEYERAQILERSRRGKIHRARQGEVSVLTRAPYGYKYVKKSPERGAYFEIIESEAEVVRMVFDFYARERLGIRAIARRLTELGHLSAKGSLWKSASIWYMLCNPAYQGKACFGRRRSVPSQRMHRTTRLKGTPSARGSVAFEPREKWIEIPVPALVSEETFMCVQEMRLQNKKLSPRRTIEPSILQGLVCCRKCSYSLTRASSVTSAKRKIGYYRCLGYRDPDHTGRRFCDQKPIRQDVLDDIVWAEVVKLLEDPSLIQAELDRRLEKARSSSLITKRHDTLVLELSRAQKSIERMVMAYQEDLLSLDELRNRLPHLRQQEKTIRVELQSLNSQAANQEAYLKLTETLSEFLERLRTSSITLDVRERQKIVRLLVREILVDNESIIIRHSIPIHSSPGSGSNTTFSPQSSPSKEALNVNYLLCPQRLWPQSTSTIANRT